MNIRMLEQVGEMRSCEQLERKIWGLSDAEVLPASHLVAAVHAGGMAAGAFDGGELVGFVCGFASYRPAWSRPNGLHSHMLGVLPDYQGRGIGKELKAFQRTWCLKRGLEWMTWTFDPLQAKNARLNLEHLGVTVSEYRVNEYGTLGGDLNAELPTDRLLALWELVGERADRLPEQPLPKALARTPDNRPEQTLISADRVLVEVPTDFTRLMQENFPLASDWRLAAREVFQHYFDLAYVATRFIDHSYLLEVKR